MKRFDSNPSLSIIIAVVSGQAALARCLTGLSEQAEEANAEIIVPYDVWTRNVLNLSKTFPKVRFVKVSIPDAFTRPLFGPARHVLYDLRRAAGLAQARGGLIAMTEDHAVPAPDWCRQIIRVHDEIKDAAAIGGAVENEVDSVLNWAWYYADFGRYGRPIRSGEIKYLSDVNVSYKREAIADLRYLWESGFQETTVHWTMRRKGLVLRLDERPVVFQHRPKSSLPAALRERLEWGRAFSATRAREMDWLGRGLLFIGCSVLPFVLFVRAVKNMLRHRQSLLLIFKVAPLVFILVSAWAVGEATGYLSRPVQGMATNDLDVAKSLSSIL